MYKTNNLGEIEALCREITNSPYFRKQTPEELTQLRAMLEKVNHLVTDVVPPLLTEVRQLRTQAKRLNAEVEALHPNGQPTQGNAPS